MCCASERCAGGLGSRRQRGNGPCIASDACACGEDLVEPIRPDLCYPARDISALERAMAAVITDTPPPQLLRGRISNYAVSKIDAVESL
jgi:hypothetical protein